MVFVGREFLIMNLSASPATEHIAAYLNGSTAQFVVYCFVIVALWFDYYTRPVVTEIQRENKFQQTRIQQLEASLKERLPGNELRHTVGN
jgi:hypothetical protein